MAIESSRCELSFRSLSIVDRACLSRFARGGGGIVTDCDAKFYESQSGDRCRYVNQFDRVDRIRHTRLLRSRPMRNARYEEGGLGTRIGRYYEKGIISACGADACSTSLRGSIYSVRMALRRCTTIIIRSYWIIALHLPDHSAGIDLPYSPMVFPKRCIPHHRGGCAPLCWFNLHS